MFSKNISSITQVVLCGGSGTRLWPLSRNGFPKQFLCINSQQSLFQTTLTRFSNYLANKRKISSPIIVTNEDHRFIASEQMRESGIKSSSFILEPKSKNTAPALTLAALKAFEEDPDSILVVTPSDHFIENQEIFLKNIDLAIQEAENDKIILLGKSPDKPETGYGYIKTIKTKEQKESLDIDGFIEKPDLSTAKLIIQDNGVFWNSGIFVMKSSIWLKAINFFAPDIFKNVQKSWDLRTIDNYFIRPDKDIFSNTRADSIDFAVIEQCPGTSFELKMIILQSNWSDLGSWESVWENSQKDKDGNHLPKDSLSLDSYNNYVYSEKKFIALSGVNNLIIIDTPDAILVTDKKDSQNVKNVVDYLNKNTRTEHLYHNRVHRPWGWFENIDSGERFKAKRIFVKPKSSLSLQKHFYRSEHWIVVRGSALVTKDKEQFVLKENQSIYIEIGQIHCLSNPTSETLEIIEIQTGHYLSEDDIIRIKDSYGRK